MDNNYNEYMLAMIYAKVKELDEVSMDWKVSLMCDIFYRQLELLENYLLNERNTDNGEEQH